MSLMEGVLTEDTPFLRLLANKSWKKWIHRKNAQAEEQTSDFIVRINFLAD